MQPPHLERLLRDLDSYTPPSSRYGSRDRHNSATSRRREIVRSEGHGNISRPPVGRQRENEWMGLEDIMLESRRELQADRQMAAGQRSWEVGGVCETLN